MQSFLSYLQEKPMHWRAGGLPFTREGDQVWVCLFVSNDPMYGGSAPQLPKGIPNAHERPQEAAEREVAEETGLPIRLLSRQAFPLTIRTTTSELGETYDIHAYGFPLPRRIAPKPGEEGTGVWVTADKALTTMRPDHRVFVRDLLQHLRHTDA